MWVSGRGALLSYIVHPWEHAYSIWGAQDPGPSSEGELSVPVGTHWCDAFCKREHARSGPACAGGQPTQPAFSLQLSISADQRQRA